MPELHAFSLLTEEDIDLGIEHSNPDKLLELGEMMATGHDNIIVHITGPGLQKWEGFQ